MAEDKDAAAPAATETRARRVRKPARKAMPKAAAKGEGWTPARRERFLEELATTCNVRHSAAQAGMCDSGAYKLRARSEPFRAKWAAALAIGYEQIELLLLQRALGSAAADGEGAAKPDPAIERLRLQLLSQHRASVQAVRVKARAETAHPAADPRRILEDRLRTMRRNLGIDG